MATKRTQQKPKDAQVAARKEARRDQAIKNATRKILERVRAYVQKAADALEVGEYVLSDRFDGEPLSLNVSLTLLDDLQNAIDDLTEEIETL